MIQSDPNDWRVRELLASQVSKTVDLFEPQEVAQSLYPIVFSLCQDQCAEVRKMSFTILYNVLKSIQDDEELFSQIK